MSQKLWGGRFEGSTHRDVEAFTSSIAVDQRLCDADLQGSIAHARMLGQAGVIPAAEAKAMVEALQEIREAYQAGKLPVRPEAEDIHSEIERWLSEKLGPVAGKLHTARSRNDQVATACRVYLRGELDAFQEEIRVLQRFLVETAEKHTETLLPGFTHLQHAQPVSLAHHLLAYFWMLERDHERLQDARKRVNQLPLGSAALAGTSFPIQREAVAQELGFEGICENSLDAVSDRDFVVEILSDCSLVMTHLSRLSEELILWSTPGFGFVELSDSVTTGSSIMPQKKNPDVAELIRGRVGRATGALMGALTMLKGLPLSYNRDLQEDKSFLFDGLDTARASVRLMHLMLSSAEWRKGRMREALHGDFSNATDLADYLVEKGLPFRQAHEVVGRIVRLCIEEKIALEEISLEKLRTASPLFERDLLDRIQPEAVLRARHSRGGAGPEAVRAQISRAWAALGPTHSES